MELPQRYNPKEAEAKWQKFWSDNDIFTYHKDDNKETYSVDTPPPTVSGTMHLGHAFSYTQQDIVVRYQRMKGKNVFFPFGTDDNGLPTEKFVEKEKKLLSRNMDRQEFIQIANDVIEIKKPEFIKSWQEIGMSADFKRSYSTINKHCQITSQASFIDLFNKGRIEKKESPVAWCVSCQTAIAQAEFESVEKGSHFNDIKFKSGNQDLIISTTRPELVPACVALFYHPKDERYKHLGGKKATVPVFNYEVPIIADESVEKDKGTGLMMVCTFGDKEDVEKWHKHHLDLRVVFEKWGKMNDLAGEFKGLSIKDGRKAILAKLEENGFLVNQKEITHATNVHERCKTPIEFMKTKQWYIKILDKKNELLEAGSKITWYPQHMKVRYDHWVENLNWDWCISRQRHFGIPIPVWQCESCQAFVIPKLDELPIDPTTSTTKNKCTCGSSKLIGETDVLDTWATSSMTPEIARNWAHKGEYDIEYINAPMDLRPQAHDIIRTWLFYTLAKSYFHFGRIPWKNVAISGHAQDSAGRKMSKSMGNGIDPIEMIEKYSADALRFWAATSKLGDDLPFQEKDLLTGQKTATKIFNASKFSLMHLKDFSPKTSQKSEVTEIFDQWLLSKLQKIIKSATESFDKYEYSKVKSEVDIYFWQIFCDQYLEIVKDRLYKPELRGDLQRKSGQQALYTTLLSILKMLAPIVPHITEEVYQLYFKNWENKESIHISSWPVFNESLVNENAEITGDLGVDVINSIRKYKSENHVSMKEELQSIVLISEETNFKEMILSIQDDLKSVLHVKEIVFEGETSTVSERFGIKIGVVNQA
ncbi:valine--tRNA ligase [Candidatus Woesearchaeota archaeon]|nr:valine--tRNA ligase [Candidatus Woesearchaeota archaeon]